MIKRTDTTNGWFLHDNKRNEYNVVNKLLEANTSGAETTFSNLDIISNGFKIRTSDSAVNASSGTYIYMAFAENPFKYALAR